MPVQTSKLFVEAFKLPCKRKPVKPFVLTEAQVLLFHTAQSWCVLCPTEMCQLGRTQFSCRLRQSKLKNVSDSGPIFFFFIKKQFSMYIVCIFGNRNCARFIVHFICNFQFSRIIIFFTQAHQSCYEAHVVNWFNSINRCTFGHCSFCYSFQMQMEWRRRRC